MLFILIDTFRLEAAEGATDVVIIAIRRINAGRSEVQGIGAGRRSGSMRPTKPVVADVANIAVAQIDVSATDKS